MIDFILFNGQLCLVVLTLVFLQEHKVLDTNRALKWIVFLNHVFSFEAGYVYLPCFQPLYADNCYAYRKTSILQM